MNGDDLREVFGASAMDRVVRTLPPIERAYAAIRFTILRQKLLSILDLLLPTEGRILDVGCGFGLFSAYFAQMAPGRAIVGVDPDARRVAIARASARTLGLRNELHVGDVRDAEIVGPFDAIYVLDVMHHIPESDQRGVLARLVDLLPPGGRLVMKDITTVPRSGLLFTQLLDRVMVGWNEPLAYRHHRDWSEMLRSLGLHVRAVRVPDVLPYPHVVIVGDKPHAAAPLR